MFANAWTTAACVLLVAASSGARAIASNPPAPTQAAGEWLNAAVARINKELAKKYELLSPTMLTEASLRGALRHAAADFESSDKPESRVYAAAIDLILTTGTIPRSSPLGLSVIKYRSDKFEDQYGPDHYVGIVSVNYCLSLRRGKQIRIVGLSELAEVFNTVRVDLPCPQDDKAETASGAERGKERTRQ